MIIHKHTNIPNLSGIYKIKNLKSNKIYIGSSVKLKNRIRSHFYRLKTRTHNNHYLQKSYDKHGEESFEVEILETFININYQTLLNLEKEYIIKYNCLNDKIGYNLMLDNSSFLKKLNKTPSHIKTNQNHQSFKVKAFDRFTGEFKYNFNSVSETALFFKTSSSNISRVCSGKLNYMKGHTFCLLKNYDKDKDYAKPLNAGKNKMVSEETKIKQSIVQSKHKIYKYDLNLNLLSIYNSCGHAERENNFKREFLRRKLDKETSFEGYYWKTTPIENIVYSL